MTRVTITESTPAAKAAKSIAGRPGRFLVQLIDAGQGSSGFYPAAALEAAARQRVFRKGLPMYLDHPTATEQSDRPERSVRDLAGSLAEDARWDKTKSALVAEATVYDSVRAVLAERAADIGVSIRAFADVTYGETIAGSRGPVVNSITEAVSADYVTRAGRGGRVLAVLESARGAGLLAHHEPAWLTTRTSVRESAPVRVHTATLAAQREKERDPWGHAVGPTAWEAGWEEPPRFPSARTNSHQLAVCGQVWPLLNEREAGLIRRLAASHESEGATALDAARQAETMAVQLAREAIAEGMSRSQYLDRLESHRAPRSRVSAWGR